MATETNELPASKGAPMDLPAISLPVQPAEAGRPVFLLPNPRADWPTFASYPWKESEEELQAAIEKTRAAWRR